MKASYVQVQALREPPCQLTDRANERITDRPDDYNLEGVFTL